MPVIIIQNDGPFVFFASFSNILLERLNQKSQGFFLRKICSILIFL